MTASKMNKMRLSDPAETILRFEKKSNRFASRFQIRLDRAMAQIRRRILRKLLLRIEREGLFYALPKKSGDDQNLPER